MSYLCSRYIEGIETRFNHPPKNDDNVNDECYKFSSGGRILGKIDSIILKKIKCLIKHIVMCFFIVIPWIFTADTPTAKYLVAFI
ncbi:hypothetical protein MLD38_021683 [Melastoma candidum]|uniref:Uncharacterized protein n=1 Tax=Melastoma candidum TaxID=119954 RepID=A0ACB9QKP9_9MYRT|nr:hypothetical protein MLD38_021683 [Melastoma candidum]